MTDCKEIGNNFYIWRNKSKTDYEIVFSIPIEENNNIINLTRSGIQNGTIRGSKGVSKWAANIWGGKGGGTILSSGFKGPTAHGSDDQLSVKQPEGYACDSRDVPFLSPKVHRVFSPEGGKFKVLNVNNAEPTTGRGFAQSNKVALPIGSATKKSITDKRENVNTLDENIQYAIEKDDEWGDTETLSKSARADNLTKKAQAALRQTENDSEHCDSRDVPFLSHYVIFYKNKTTRQHTFLVNIQSTELLI